MVIRCKFDGFFFFSSVNLLCMCTYMHTHSTYVCNSIYYIYYYHCPDDILLYLLLFLSFFTKLYICLGRKNDG